MCQGHNNYNVAPRFTLGFGLVVQHRLLSLSFMTHGLFPDPEPDGHCSYDTVHGGPLCRPLRV